MDTQDGKRVDRSRWGPGPWDSEPMDKVQWTDPSTGYACLAVRSRLGAWCGYVGVTRSHPWYGVDYRECTAGEQAEDHDRQYCEHSPGNLTSVHGGLTYSNACNGAICHAPEPGEPDDVWWFGFDTAHHMDLVPGLRAAIRALPALEFPTLRAYRPDGTYRTLDYVRAETARLAMQALAARP